MTNKQTFSPARCYGIFFLVVTIMLGCLFILQATDIYFGALEARETARAETLAQAEKEGWSEVFTDVKVAVAVNSIPIYSRQIVAQRLMKLLPYVCIWLAALIGGIILAVLRPNAPSNKRDPDVMLDEKLKASRKRIPSTAKAGQEDPFEAAVAQCQQIRKQSRILLIAVAVIGVICLAIPFAYLLDASHFPGQSVTDEVRSAALYALPFLLVLFGGAIAYVYVHHSMMQKESAAIKAAVAAGERTQKTVTQKKIPVQLIARISLLVIGLGLFILGTQNGSMHEVLVKAINICTECIGLG